MVPDPTYMRITRYGQLVMSFKKSFGENVGIAFRWPGIADDAHWADSCCWSMKMSDYRDAKDPYRLQQAYALKRFLMQDMLHDREDLRAAGKAESQVLSFNEGLQRDGLPIMDG